MHRSGNGPQSGVVCHRSPAFIRGTLQSRKHRQHRVRRTVSPRTSPMMRLKPLFCALFILAALSPFLSSQQSARPGAVATLFEGARLIAGDGSDPIDARVNPIWWSFSVARAWHPVGPVARFEDRASPERAAFDLFGNGKTVVRSVLPRVVESPPASFDPGRSDATSTSTVSETRLMTSHAGFDNNAGVLSVHNCASGRRRAHRQHPVTRIG